MTGPQGDIILADTRGTALRPKGGIGLSQYLSATPDDRMVPGVRVGGVGF